MTHSERLCAAVSACPALCKSASMGYLFSPRRLMGMLGTTLLGRTLGFKPKGAKALAGGALKGVDPLPKGAPAGSLPQAGPWADIEDIMSRFRGA